MKAISANAVSLLLIGVSLSLMKGALAQSPKPDVPRSGTNANSKEDDGAIRKVITGIEEAWNAHDMNAYGKLLRADVEWVNVVGMHWKGRDDVMAAHDAFHRTIFKNHRIKTDDVQIRQLCTGYAIAVVTTTNDAFTTPDGHVISKRQDRQTYVLAKGPEVWKVVHCENVWVDAEAAKNDPVNRNDGPAKEDLKALQGTWLTMKLVTDGKVEVDLKEPPIEGTISVLTYTGHKWVLKLGDQELASGTSKWDPSQTPKHIDLTHESGPLKGQTVLGIYKLVGDEYTACIAAAGKERPSEFSSKEGSGQRLVISRREKR